MNDKKKEDKAILSDHKKIGKKLIPPFLQMPNVEQISFAETVLPSLIWLSAIFIRHPDNEAVRKSLDFLKKCTDILKEPNALVFMNNFEQLNNEQKLKIMTELDEDLVCFLRENLIHQHVLLTQYPLSFLFNNYTGNCDKNKAILMLREDVAALLNRRSLIATKVQTTAFVSMCTSGKLKLSSSINMPDLNSIFIDPDSDDSKKVASMMRASMNINAGFKDEAGDNSWAEHFWHEAFLLEECT
ncbi:hypothetical protein [Legionella cincinnatiensis]|uniref:Uncharacterized protein n=1 Tax=Legionella cincinnatiensis TaxID=28085 RepID=A0A378IG97_9GAMM|nr:hypothetical protein [Legionella cincinnatiensis]KTC84338.1 hypothetical protein Lcin_1901 [Legionella cincinnatiensis]STX34016.1 Uncharacterised protein [Legionella cincinnatiensis]